DTRAPLIMPVAVVRTLVVLFSSSTPPLAARFLATRSSAVCAKPGTAAARAATKMAAREIFIERSPVAGIQIVQAKARRDARRALPCTLVRLDAPAHHHAIDTQEEDRAEDGDDPPGSLVLPVKP